MRIPVLRWFAALLSVSLIGLAGETLALAVIPDAQQEVLACSGWWTTARD